MSHRKKVKVKTTTEDIGDLTLASHFYDKFRERDEQDTPPEPETAWSEWMKKKNKSKRITKDSTEDDPNIKLPDVGGTILEADRGTLFNKTHKFYPGRSKF